MPLVVKRIPNSPVNSNSFVIYDKDISDKCFVVDPGTKECHELEDFIALEHLAPAFILLTHEHFDHCWGCNYLQKKYSIPIYGSEECINKIRSHKTNFSVFYDPSISFDVNGTVRAIHPAVEVKIDGYEMAIISTPGHTNSSISILVENHLFTGDALIKGYKTVTKLPGGSKEKNMSTLEYFRSLKDKGIIVHPGHLEEFILDDFFMQH